MFQSFRFIEWYGASYSPYREKYRCQIIDLDFEDVIIVSVPFRTIAISTSVIEVYFKRNLPIAPNLIRAMLWYRDKYNISLDDQYISNKNHSPYWKSVEQDIKKYLLFS